MFQLCSYQGVLTDWSLRWTNQIHFCPSLTNQITGLSHGATSTTSELILQRKRKTSDSFSTDSWHLHLIRTKIVTFSLLCNCGDICCSLCLMVSAITLASRLFMCSPLCSYCQQTMLHLLDHYIFFDTVYRHFPFPFVFTVNISSVHHTFPTISTSYFHTVKNVWWWWLLLWSSHRNQRVYVTRAGTDPRCN